MFDFILGLFEGLILVKLGFLILSIFYIIFLVVVYRQTSAMERVIKDNGASTLVNGVAIFNVILAISLFVAALFIL